MLKQKDIREKVLQRKNFRHSVGDEGRGSAPVNSSEVQVS